MKTLPFCFFFLSFLLANSYHSQAAQRANDYVIISLIVSPGKKVQQKKEHWKKKTKISLLEKRLKKKVAKLQAKATKKERKLQTHPLAIVSITMIPLGIAFVALFSSISGMAALALGVAAGLTSIITGIISAHKIKKYPERYRGKGWAVLGTVISSICIVLVAAILIILANAGL